MPNLIGQSLGRYHILEQLGEGGMAVVYKAFDTRLEADVAVKVIRTERLIPEIAEKTLKRFEREAKALAKLTHPNIVKVLDYGKYKGKPYLVMPYLPGGTLKQRIKQGALPWQEAVKLLIPIAEALAYAHQHGIIHRDIKPSNILITESGAPMLSDFGVAKLFDAEETMDLTGTGMGVGTPGYMAPEQWTEQVTAQSDIYSLGVVCFEMITGHKLYQADTPAAILIKQINDPLPHPSQFVPALPELVEKMLIKALTKDTQNRFPDMRTMLQAMQGLLENRLTTNVLEIQHPRSADATLDTLDTRAEEDTQNTVLENAEATGIRDSSDRPFLPQKQAIKSNFPVWARALITVLGICLLSGGGVLLWMASSWPTATATVIAIPHDQNVDQIPPADDTVVPVPIPNVTETDTPTSTTKPIPIIGGGSGDIYFSRQDGLYRIRTDGTNLTKVLSLASPGRIVWLDQNTFIIAGIMGFINGNEITTSEFHVLGESLAWSKSDQQLVSGHNYRIYIQDASGNNISRIDLNLGISCITLSPDGQKVAMLVNGEPINGVFASGTSLQIMDLTSRNIFPYKFGIGYGCIDWSPDGQWIAYSGGGNNRDEVLFPLPTLNPGIYIMDSENSYITEQLTSTAGADPAWSPDGQWLVFCTQEGIYTIKNDGTEERQLLSMADIKYPVWQP